MKVQFHNRLRTVFVRQFKRGKQASSTRIWMENEYYFQGCQLYSFFSQLRNSNSTWILRLIKCKVNEWKYANIFVDGLLIFTRSRSYRSTSSNFALPHRTCYLSRKIKFSFSINSSCHVWMLRLSMELIHHKMWHVNMNSRLHCFLKWLKIYSPQ